MFKDFWPILKVILRFAVIYMVLLYAYQFYLNYFENSALDPFSKWVASQSTYGQNAFGYKSQMVDDLKLHSSYFFINGKYVSRMVEGCNAISIMILFLSFIFVFYKGAKTFLFASFGLVIIHIMNVVRIMWLNMILLNFPDYGHIGHEYFFPAIIYGTIVLLWLIWVKFFVLKTENKD